MAGVNASHAFTLLAKPVFAETVVTTARSSPLRAPSPRVRARLAAIG